MSRKPRTFVLFVVSAVLVAGSASAFLITRASRDVSAPSAQTSAQPQNTKALRNLSLRPEALSVSRRLGKRFNPSSRAISSSSGSLAIGATQQPVTLVRRQTESGETVELVLGSRSLTWSERAGSKAASGLITDTEGVLIERLVLDSPDQFVLAQLRGASYFTVARNVRPADASDGYSGPLWNVVRVNEPDAEENLRPMSSWRLFYINQLTGLPDRVEYELNGQQIRAEFLDWSEQNGEKTPWHIRWSSNEQPVMEYRVTNVSHNQ